MPAPIADAAELAALAARLGGADAIGVDTEFLRERTYYAQLCLLQLSAPQLAECVDTLALPDLDALRAPLGAPAVQKIMHAARQDLEVLWPVCGPVRNVFDTQTAAGLIGLPAQIGYGDLVSRLLGIQLHKGQTRTDWSRRPLSAAQLEYALDDVRHLLGLREQLLAQLAQLGRVSWFEEEMRQTDALASFVIDPQQAWRRVRGLADLDEGRQRLAQTLGAWRELRAMRADRPRGWILPDEALREIVLRVPRSAASLARISELPEGIATRSGAPLLELVSAAAIPDPAPPLPQRHRPEPEQLARVARLADLTRKAAQALAVAAEILATRKELEKIAAGDLTAAPLVGWRRAVIGEALLQAL